MAHRAALSDYGTLSKLSVVLGLVGACGMLALFLFAMGESIKLLIDIEQYSRETSEAIAELRKEMPLSERDSNA